MVSLSYVNRQSYNQFSWAILSQFFNIISIRYFLNAQIFREIIGHKRDNKADKQGDVR